MDYKYNCQSKFQSFKQTLDDIVSSIRKTTFFERKEKKKKTRNKKHEERERGEREERYNIQQFLHTDKIRLGINLYTREREGEREKEIETERQRERERQRQREKFVVTSLPQLPRRSLARDEYNFFSFFFKILQNIEKRVVKNFCARYIIYVSLCFNYIFFSFFLKCSRTSIYETERTSYCTIIIGISKRCIYDQQTGVMEIFVIFLDSFFFFLDPRS